MKDTSKEEESALNMKGTFSLSENKSTFGTLGLSFIKVSILVELILITLFFIYLAQALANYFPVILFSMSKEGIGIGGNTLKTGKSLIFSFSHISG